MATVTTSIGQGTTHDTTTLTISSVTGSGPTYTVTMNTGETSNFDVGDALWDEHATPRKYLVTAISGDDLTVRDSEGVGGAPDNSGTSSAAAKRYYNGSTPLADWEADLDDTNIYAASDDAVGECWNDAAFDEKLTVNGGNTIGLTSVTLSVASSERHDGTAGTGARIVLSSGANENYTLYGATTGVTLTFEWIEVDNNAQNVKSVAAMICGSTTAYVCKTILHGASSNTNPGGSTGGVSVAGSGNPVNHLSNNIVYDCVQVKTTGSTDTHGISLGGGSTSTATAYNNTVHDIRRDTVNDSWGLVTEDTGTKTLKNNIVTDPDNGSTSGTEQCYSFGSRTEDYNLASDTSTSGANSLNSKASANQFVSTTGGSEDLHLKSGADAIDAGTDLNTTPTGVNIDIDGRDRDAQGDTWDMGAHELVAAANYPLHAQEQFFGRGIGRMES